MPLMTRRSSDRSTPRTSVGRWGVQSRSEVGWIVSESPRLVCPSFADVLVGSEPPQGLETLSEVVGVEEGFEVLSELLVGLVVIAPNGGFLEGAVHPLDLTVGPGMVRFGEAVLDTMLAADAVEHVQRSGPSGRYAVRAYRRTVCRCPSVQCGWCRARLRSALARSRPLT